MSSAQSISNLSGEQPEYQENNRDSDTCLDIRLSNNRHISLKNLTGKTVTLEFGESETFKMRIQDKEGVRCEEEVINVGENQNITFSNHNIQIKSAEFMKIFVEHPEGNIFTMQCYPYDTIGKIKKMIHDELGISQLDQNLLFEGKKLEDGRTLCDYKIQHETKIQLELCSVVFPNDIRIEGEGMEEVPTSQEQLGHSDSENQARFTESQSGPSSSARREAQPTQGHQNAQVPLQDLEVPIVRNFGRSVELENRHGIDEVNLVRIKQEPRENVDAPPFGEPELEQVAPLFEAQILQQLMELVAEEDRDEPEASPQPVVVNKRKRRKSHRWTHLKKGKKPY